MKIVTLLFICCAGCTTGLAVHEPAVPADTARKARVRTAVYDGFVVAGYVDQGGFLNFTGPNINLTFRSSKWILGMLPSLRVKEDTGTPHNAFVTPNLGLGLSYCYKSLVLQLPFYYNAKTAVKNGQWYAGLGIGWRLKK